MSAEQKYTVIQRYRHKYSVKAMCTFFSVSCSGYYAFEKRKPAENEAELVNLIRQCRQEPDKTYGYRRVCIWLDRRGIHVNHKKVYRLMEQYGLFSEIRRWRKYQQMQEKLHCYPNLLNREFTAAKQNEKWVTDISYIGTPQGTLYLSIIRDLFDNSIVTYQLGTKQSINLVLRTIRAAREKEAVAAELQLHSDQGLQYMSNSYFTLTRAYDITPSMSRCENYYDNAMAENFFGILKSECLRRYKPKTIEQAKLLIDKFIYFYNYEHIQLKTKLMPLEKRRQFA